MRTPKNQAASRGRKAVKLALTAGLLFVPLMMPRAVQAPTAPQAA